MNDNEKLIEEARDRVAKLADAVPPTQRVRILAGEVEDERTSLIIRLADALEAAEKAHTPTDDERDEVRTAIDYLDELIEIFSHRVDVQHVLRWVIEKLRRPVHPEPSGYRATLVHEAREHADHYRRFDDTESLVSTLVEMANALAASSEPLGEPSDAQALIRGLRKLLNAHSLHGDVPADEIDALLDSYDERAASVATKQGGNR